TSSSIGGRTIRVRKATKSGCDGRGPDSTQDPQHASREDIAEQQEDCNPDKRGTEIHCLEAPQRHREDAAYQRNRRPQGTGETADEHRRHAPTLYKSMAAR